VLSRRGRRIVVPSHGAIGDGVEGEFHKKLEIMVHPNPNTVAHGSGPFFVAQASRRPFFRRRDACTNNRVAPLFRFSSISKTTGHFLWRVARPSRDQLAQLAGDTTVEFQIGPQFDSHGNIPMFRADANKPFEFRMDVHHRSPLFLSRQQPFARLRCKSGSYSALRSSLR
jgi:hypothetical protein